MKILYYGGQKSGKSRLAEAKTLALAKTKPYYIATYDNSYHDTEMKVRIEKHQSQREEQFISIEEPFHLTKVIQPDESYLVDCISMWIHNTQEEPEETVFTQIEAICAIDANIIFVLNDVSSGVIPIDKESRRYIDRSGIAGQKLAALCDEVYEVKLGLETRLK